MGAQRGSRHSRRFFLITAATLVSASILTIAGAMATGGSGTTPERPHAVAGAVLTPSAAAEPPSIDAPGATEASTLIETGPSATAPAPNVTEAAGPTPPPIASSVSVTPTIGDAASATPSASTPEPVAPLTPAAASLAVSLEQEYGVRVLTDGQDWGDDEATQLRNIGAVGAALADMPDNVLAAVSAARPLTFLSNRGGRTEAGWQPYGDREANFYCNEDRTSSGQVAANQVVLQPGANSQTIAHEMIHAYQMRDSGPGDYAAALLTPEMGSFMQATGWVQTGSDDEVRAAAASGWDSLDSLFEYNGRSLAYTNEFGDSMTLYAPNPLEAYAEAGGLYYGRADSLTLPDWPEYWAWFAANLG